MFRTTLTACLMGKWHYLGCSAHFVRQYCVNPLAPPPFGVPAAFHAMRMMIRAGRSIYVA